ncbi:type II toxin-antitoxin system SpoIISA family toxin [Sporolactobacillus terrae]|uniref:type II toxin-antitoxin system SpoIISA family toxin n=1 Tax=Sporolactobacillus terrae TaxID=269673 RepID=UPI00111A5F09|nr:type II toxin-antitoxin system SpoIISA family toxin [Sporolactobacillus terrae]
MNSSDSKLHKVVKKFNLSLTILEFLAIFIIFFCLARYVSTWNKDAFLNFLFGTIGIFLIVILAYYWTNNRLFFSRFGRIRRTYYTLYLTLVVIGLMLGQINFNNWTTLLQLMGIAVFADLAIIQNPSILKIWNAEFKNDSEMIESLTNSQNVIFRNAKKVEHFSEILQRTHSYFDEQELPDNTDKYLYCLKQFLNQYTDHFNFIATVFPFPTLDSDTPDKSKITEQAEKINVMLTLKFNDDQMNTLINGLMNREIQIVKENQCIAFPYYGSYLSMIVTIKTAVKDFEIDVIDASHILNLLNIFDWYTVSSNSDNDNL